MAENSMPNYQKIVFKPTNGLEGLFQAVDESLPIRTIEKLLERTNLSADSKAIILDVAHFAVRVGERIVSLGRKIVTFAIKLIQTIPGTTLGVALALVLGSLTTGALGGIPLIGAALAGFLKTVLLVFGLTSGVLSDLRSGELATRIDALVAVLSPLESLR